MSPPVRVRQIKPGDKFSAYLYVRHHGFLVLDAAGTPSDPPLFAHLAHREMSSQVEIEAGKILITTKTGQRFLVEDCERGAFFG